MLLYINLTLEMVMLYLLFLTAMEVLESFI